MTEQFPDYIVTPDGQLPVTWHKNYTSDKILHLFGQGEGFTVERALFDLVPLRSALSNYRAANFRTEAQEALAPLKSEPLDPLNVWRGYLKINKEKEIPGLGTSLLRMMDRHLLENGLTVPNKRNPRLHECANGTSWRGYLGGITERILEKPPYTLFWVS